MDRDGFILHGAVVTSVDETSADAFEDACVVCVDGLCEGVFTEIPSSYADLPVEDFQDKLIAPGFLAEGLHAPAFQLRGLFDGAAEAEHFPDALFNEELLLRDPAYAEQAYDLFVEELYAGPFTRAFVSGSPDAESTLILMDMLESTGLVSYVAKVNMDEHVPPEVCENTEDSLGMTLGLYEAAAEEDYKNTQLYLSPRAGCCSEKMLRALDMVREEYGLILKEQNPGDALYGEAPFGRGARPLRTDADGPEAHFYRLTKGACSSFGNTGCFEKGREFDAVVFEDFSLPTMLELSPWQRMIRLLALGDDRNVVGKYVRGRKLY